MSQRGSRGKYDASQGNGRKAQASLNHLLNFSFPPRLPVHEPRTRKKSTTQTPYSKEKYVNANFRFVVNAFGDYGMHTIDADTAIEWKHIEQVIVADTRAQHCPICLSTPVAPRITKCGHVYCFACMLHYLAVGQEEKKQPWRTCPICWEAVRATDLKSALIKVHTESQGRVALRLVKKPHHSMMVLGRSTSTWLDNVAKIPIADVVLARNHAQFAWDFYPEASIFSRMILMGHDYMLGQYQSDTRQLQASLEEAHSWGNENQIPFIEGAIQQVKDKVEALEAMDHGLLYSVREQALQAMQAPRSNPSKAYYYYQAADGQNGYLHALDTRILKHEYGDFDALPDSLSVVLAASHETTMAQDVRKRFKHLAHIPLGCDMVFYEVDFEASQIVSPDTLAHYSKALEERKKLAQLKHAYEEHQAQPSDVEVDGVHLDLDHDFPAALATTSSSTADDGVSFSNVVLRQSQRVNPLEWAQMTETERRQLVHMDYGQEKTTVDKKGRKKTVLLSNSAAPRRR